MIISATAFCILMLVVGLVPLDQADIYHFQVPLVFLLVFVWFDVLADYDEREQKALSLVNLARWISVAAATTGFSSLLPASIFTPQAAVICLGLCLLIALPLFFWVRRQLQVDKIGSIELQDLANTLHQRLFSLSEQIKSFQKGREPNFVKLFKSSLTKTWERDAPPLEGTEYYAALEERYARVCRQLEDYLSGVSS